jgi:hypothetical membrane protein
MKPSQMIQTFHERYPFVGPSFWMASVQYYIVQIIVALAWTMPYSLRFNTISDLGNTACGPYNDRYVCSPLHGLMNTSFVILGITMILGAILIYHEFSKSFGSALGFSFMAIAGFGSILVGAFPENTIHNLHLFGTALPFLIGNLGLLLLGSVLDIPMKLRVYTLFSGLLALLALVLFTTHTYFGLGIGGMERIVAYPQTMWLIVFGIYISGNRMRALKAKQH